MWRNTQNEMYNNYSDSRVHFLSCVIMPTGRPTQCQDIDYRFLTKRPNTWPVTFQSNSGTNEREWDIFRGSRKKRKKLFQKINMKPWRLVGYYVNVTPQGILFCWWLFVGRRRGWRMASGCAEEKRDNLEGRLVHRSLPFGQFKNILKNFPR